MKYSVFSPTELVSGAGCVRSFSRYKEFGARCVIITGKNMLKKCAAVSDACAALEANNIKYFLIAEAENNPSVESVFAFAEKITEFSADFIIGIGGGSSMDTAKAAALIAANFGVTKDTVFSYEYKNPMIPTILIGTTAGTGSEVMPSAVLTVNGEISVKKSLKTRDSYAKVALCDAGYTASMPDNVTVSTVLDSVCHAIEAIYSKKAGEWAKIYGHTALETVFPALSDFIAGSGNIDEIREKLYFGSLLAGLAINDGGTSFPHSMGYMLTTMHETPHGFACAVFISQFIERVSKISDVSRTLSSCGFSTVDNFGKTIEAMINKYHKRPVFDDETAEKYAEIAMSLSVGNNYLSLDKNDCVEIYKEMMKRDLW